METKPYACHGTSESQRTRPRTPIQVSGVRSCKTTQGCLYVYSRISHDSFEQKSRNTLYLGVRSCTYVNAKNQGSYFGLLYLVHPKLCYNDSWIMHVPREKPGPLCQHLSCVIQGPKCLDCKITPSPPPQGFPISVIVSVLGLFHCPP